MTTKGLDIYFGMPSHDGTVCLQTMMSFDHMSYFMSEKKVSMIRPYLQGSSLPELRDDMCAEGALEKGARYLMFIDADMVFNPDAVWRLMQHNVDVAVGLYFSKSAPHAPMCAIGRPDGTTDNYMNVPDFHDKMREGALVEVAGAGTGFMLIKREVLEKVERPRFMFPWRKQYVAGEPEPVWGYGGEDYYFCRKARNAGFKVFVDFSLRLGHVGSHVYSVVDHMRYQQLMAMEAQKKEGERSLIEDITASENKKKIDIQLAR